MVRRVSKLPINSLGNSPNTLTNVEDYGALLLSGVPLIDVRAPVEFAVGALPNAYNLPLLNDEERHAVGLCYRQHGQAAAISLGHKLVAGERRDQRITAWRDFIASHPLAVLYCARGGLRSQISQQWLGAAGLVCSRIAGGYKAARAALLTRFESHCINGNLIVLGGMTGTGKTQLLKQVPRMIDLEGAANHKGSSFGRPLDPQPSQVDFENRIALDLQRLLDHADTVPVVVEDEGRMIGARQLPHIFLDRMRQSPIVIIEMSLDERVGRLWQEYIVDRHQATQARYPDHAEAYFARHLTDSLTRIRKRLGGARTQDLLARMESALKTQHRDHFGQHRDWLTRLVRDYYDPMYCYQLEQKRTAITFSGTPHQVKAWLLAQTEQPA